MKVTILKSKVPGIFIGSHYIVFLEAERSSVVVDKWGKLQGEVMRVGSQIYAETQRIVEQTSMEGRIEETANSYYNMQDLIRDLVGVEKPPVSKVNAMPSQNNSVFISYRHEDSSDICGRIYDRLERHFGRENVFKDVDSIPLGVNFAEILREAVSSCKVFLVVIGKYWLVDASGDRRLNNANDFVRIEIETALKEHKPIIPLQVQGATIPNEAELPPSLRLLSYQNGRAIRRDPDFHKDVDVVIKAIEKIFMT
jgi:hypothetical protein